MRRRKRKAGAPKTQSTGNKMGTESSKYGKQRDDPETTESAKPMMTENDGEPPSKKRAASASGEPKVTAGTPGRRSRGFTYNLRKACCLIDPDPVEDAGEPMMVSEEAAKEPQVEDDAPATKVERGEDGETRQRKESDVASGDWEDIELTPGSEGSASDRTVAPGERVTRIQVEPKRQTDEVTESGETGRVPKEPTLAGVETEPEAEGSLARPNDRAEIKEDAQEEEIKEVEDREDSQTQNDVVVIEELEDAGADATEKEETVISGDGAKEKSDSAKTDDVVEVEPVVAKVAAEVETTAEVKAEDRVTTNEPPEETSVVSEDVVKEVDKQDDEKEEQKTDVEDDLEDSERSDHTDSENQRPETDEDEPEQQRQTDSQETEQYTMEYNNDEQVESAGDSDSEKMDPVKDPDGEHVQLRSGSDSETEQPESSNFQQEDFHTADESDKSADTDNYESEEEDTHGGGGNSWWSPWGQTGAGERAKKPRLVTQWSSKDTRDYRQGYPGKKDDLSLKDNLLFYKNAIESEPRGDYIDNIHRDWWGNFDLLESHHGFIQWLFPIRESGVNYQAQELQLHEAEAIKSDRKALARVLKSYQMMLDFYGMELEDKQKGTIKRAPHFRERYRHLSRSMHNYLRITRILKSLGELGYEHLKTPFVEFVLREIFEEGELRNCQNSCVQYWLHTIKSGKDRKRLIKYVEENY